MGYKPKKKVYKLIFEDPELNGLEVKATSTPLGSFLDSMTDLTTKEEKPSDKLEARVAMASATVGAFEKQLAEFANCLVEWNLEFDDGTPVPATVEGLRTQDIDFVKDILTAWQEAISGVSGPLDDSSTSGESSLVASLPMETLSASQAS